MKKYDLIDGDTVKEFSESIEKTHENNQTNLEQYRLFCKLITFNFGATE